MRALVVSGLLVLVLSLGLRLAILQTQDYDPDEMQHLHIAWCISQGLVPYRDFFEHHAPLMHFALAPLIAHSSVTTDAEAALRFITGVRVLMVVNTAFLLLALFLLGRLWRGWRVGLLAAVLLVNETLFLSKTLEIRPDGPGVTLLLAALCLLLAGLRSDRPGPFLASGLVLGGALVCSLKTLFAGPPLALSLAWYAVWRRSLAGLRNLALWGAGCLVPLVLLAIGFARQGAFFDLLHGTLVVSAVWPERFSPLPYLQQVWQVSPLASVLAVAAFVRYLVQLRRREAVERADYLVVLAFAGLFGGTFVISVPWAQYHLLYLPLGALLAAGLVVELVGPRDGRLAVVLLLLASGPLLALRTWPQQLNDHSVRQLRFVLENSRPDETVLDGWMSRAPFRPHAYRYYFLNNEMRLLLPRAERLSFLLALRDGRINPKLIMLDEHLELWCRDAVPFYHRYYRPTEVGPIWIRKEGSTSNQTGPGNQATDSETIPTPSR